MLLDVGAADTEEGVGYAAGVVSSSPSPCLETSDSGQVELMCGCAAGGSSVFDHPAVDGILLGQIVR